MKDACMKGCGRTFTSMEAAERHEDRCNGQPAKRRAPKTPTVRPVQPPMWKLAQNEGVS